MKISKGISYMLFATLIFSIMNVMVKYIKIPPVEIALFRSVISLIMCIFTLKRLNIPIFGKNKGLLIVRGFFGAFALILYFISLQNNSLATATILYFLSPIFTAILASIFLKEKLKALQIFFFIITFIGVYFVKGFDQDTKTVFLIVGIVSAFLAGAAYNVIRKIKLEEHPVVIVLYFPLVTIPIAGLLTLVATFTDIAPIQMQQFAWVNPDLEQWGILISIGILTQFAQLYMTKSYQHETAANASGASYIGVIYALIFSVIIFNEVITWYVTLGATLVIIGVVLNIMYNNHLVKKEKELNT